MTLGPIAPRTRRDDVVDAIRRSILTGRLAPGARLVEKALALDLDVSRPTLREAIQQLVSEGLLVLEPYKGAHVVVPDAQMLLEIAAVRNALETLGAVETARRAQSDPTVGQRLQRSLDELEAAIAAADPVRVLDAHVRVHTAIVDAAGNNVLAQLWQVIDSQTRLTLSVDQHDRQDFERIRRDHHRLIEVIMRGDEREISESVRNHILASAAELVAMRTTPGNEATPGA